jgi:hypothetical protein
MDQGYKMTQKEWEKYKKELQEIKDNDGDIWEKQKELMGKIIPGYHYACGTIWHEWEVQDEYMLESARKKNEKKD